MLRAELQLDELAGAAFALDQISRSRLDVWGSSDAFPATKTKPIKFKEKDA
jgi:hypothetical protein